MYKRQGQDIYQYQDGTATLLYTAQDILVSFAVTNGTLWVSTGESWFENETYQQNYAVTVVNGETESSFDLSTLPDFLGGVYAFAAGPSGTVYGLSSDDLIILDGAATLTGQISLEDTDTGAFLWLDNLAEMCIRDRYQRHDDIYRTAKQ